jgi:hypothetical protein
VAGLLSAIPDPRAAHEHGPPSGSAPPFAASAAIPPPPEPQSPKLLRPLDATRPSRVEEPGIVDRPPEVEAATRAKLAVGTAPELSASMPEEPVVNGIGRSGPAFRDISAMTAEEHEASFDRICLEIGEYVGKAAGYYLAIGEKLGEAKRHYDLMTGTGHGKRNPQGVSPFAELVAEKSGLTSRSIQLYVQVGRLDDAAKVTIARAPKATLTNLIKLARLKPEKQLAAAQTLTKSGQKAFDELVVVPRKKRSPPSETELAPDPPASAAAVVPDPPASASVAALVPAAPASADPSLAIASVVAEPHPGEDNSLDDYAAFVITPNAPVSRVPAGHYIVQIRVDSISEGKVVGSLFVELASSYAAPGDAADRGILAEVVCST